MENLIIRSLEKIRKASRRSEKDLRQACDNVLQGLKSAKAEGVAEHQPGAGAADKYFLPFKLACASTLTKVQGASLDCIEKQIAHGYLRGSAPVAVVDENGDVIDGETQTLMDVVIQTICKCKDATNSDNVQLQVIKGLLTAVSSSTCEVHSKSLVMAVQACYHIYLITRNEVNRTTAKACLTQMLHVVFRKMELEHGAIENERMRNLIESSAELKTPQKPGMAVNGKPKGYLGINDTDYGKPTINGLSVSAVTDLPIYPAVAEMLGIDVSCFSKSSEPDDDNDIALLNKLEFRSLLHQDAFFIFRALCKLAMKTSNDNNNNRDEWGLKSKLLSLELIFSVLDQAGPAFRGSKIFLAQIRTQLCRALIQNCLSNQHEIVCISLRIFMVLVNRFKDHVVEQVEIFINQIFLRIIESSNSSFEHKILVLDVFYRICQDANVVVELFLNYDDTHESGSEFSNLPQMQGLFERIVHALERVAQGVSMSSDGSMVSNKDSKSSIAQDLKLRKVALASLVGILDSLIKFTDENDRSDSISRSGTMYSDGSNNQRDVTTSDIDPNTPNRPNNPNAAPADGEWEEDAKETDSEDNENAVSTPFDKKRSLQRDLETAFLKFKMKPKNGIEYLISKKHLKRDPVDVASFLRRYPDELDKTQCGDYLGNEKPFNIKVLYAYIDSMDFTRMEFDNAIRFFLSGFRLPGEAQKIDRIMEKFAERFHRCNKDLDCTPGRWESADTAFVLGYSIIMLNTDLHNPNIKPEKKMSLPQFVNQCKEIDGGNDIEYDYLAGVYSRIKENAISLKEDDDLRDAVKPSGGIFFDESRFRAKMFNKERDTILGGAEAMLTQFQGKKTQKRIFRSAAAFGNAHIKPMFNCAWEPMLAVFSVMLATTDNQSIVELCLRGVRHSIHIAAVESLETPLMTFVACLVKFTGLQEPFAHKGNKEIECMKALVAVALSDGNYLGAVWDSVLAAISQVSRLHFAASGVKSIAFAQNQQKKENQNGGFSGGVISIMSGMVNLNQPTDEELKRTKAEEMRSVAQFVMDRIDVRSIDRIFTSSPRISAKAIHFFVAALCKVSLKELNDARNVSGFSKSDQLDDTQSQPRIFSLQKVVEVADFNISCRGRITWAKIWHELSGYFTSVGCHKEPSIAMYAIDSLKQLSMKFLEKEELEGFQFQKQFLRPFETIVRKSKNPATKELILCVVQHIVLARVDMLKSGWSQIFSVLKVAGNENNAELVQLGFSILDRITKDHFALAAEHDFVGLTKCLLRYSCSISVNISLSALAHVRNCISNLADGAVPIRDCTDDELKQIEKNERITFSNIPRHTELWWPMLTGLAQLVTEPRIEVRMRAVQSLFGSLNTVGKQFSEDLWQVIFQQILFRIFDDVDVMAREQLTKGRQDEHSWMQTTCMAALGALIDLFSIYFDILKFLLPGMMQLLRNCIDQEIQDLACIGIVCLKQLFILVGSRLDDEMWDECCKFFVLLNQDTMPSVLIEAKQAMELPVSDSPPTPPPRPTKTPSMNNTPEEDADAAKVPETNEFPKENMNEQNVVSETENTTSKKLLWMQTRLKNGFLPFNEQKVFSQCKIQLEMLPAIGEIIKVCFPTLRARHLKKLIGCLKHAYAVAAVFNSSKEYRVAMANAGFMRHLNLKRLPNLLRQETVSLVQLLRVLFRVYKEVDSEDFVFSDEWKERQTLVSEQIKEISISVISRYIKLDTQVNLSGAIASPTDIEEGRMMINVTPLLVQILTGFLRVRDEQFIEHIDWLYPILGELVQCSSRDLRCVLKEILVNRVGPLVCKKKM